MELVLPGGGAQNSQAGKAGVQKRCRQMGQCLPKADKQRAADGITCFIVVDCECIGGGNEVGMSGFGHRTGQLYGVAKQLETTYGGVIGCPEPVLDIVRRCYRVL